MSKKSVVSKDDTKSTAPETVGSPVPHPLVDLRDEVDRLFDRFSTRFPSLPTGRSLFDWDPFGGSRGAAGFAAPSVDIAETDESYDVTADLPGVSEKDINVELKDDVLTVSGEKKEESEKKQKDYRLSERRFGSFKRSFRLPSGVDEDKVTANFKDGVLKVVLPKSAEARKKSRKIDIAAG